MKNKKILRIILFVLIVAWACLVFNLSSQNGEESSGLSHKLVSLFTSNEEIINKVEPYVRKLAHFSEYGVGGVLFISLFSTYEWKVRKKISVSILLGIWYAILDEVHQLMVPGRNGAILDVCIDSSGFIVGVCVMFFILKLVLKVKIKHKINLN